MKKLDIKYKLDDLIYRSWNLYLDARGMDAQTRGLLRANAGLKDRHRGQRCFILGNGPSLNEQDLGLLHNEQTFACNFFYRHPQAQACNPKYYVIVDPKITTGEWPVSMLDEIFGLFPGIHLLMSVEFRQHAGIAAALRDRRVSWVLGGKIIHPGYGFAPDLSRRIGGDNVTKFALQAALYMGFSDVALMGIDGDGLFRELLGKSSHFYDGSDNPHGADYDRMVLDLWFCTEGFRGWRAIADRYRDGPVRIWNAGFGGLLNCFPRRPLAELVAAPAAAAEGIMK